MTPLTIFLLVLAAAIVTLASYISRIYSEFGKILSREVQDNIDAWQQKVEPHLGLSREHAALSASVLQQLALGVIALEFGAVLFDRGAHMGRPTFAEIAQAVLGVVLVVVFCNQIFPAALFDLTSGRWAAKILWPVRLLLWSVTPATVFVRFFSSVASLAEPPQNPQQEAAVNVEALLEAGQEEGILKEADRDLVRSAVEFGDKLVREVMTPRPQIFAVPASITLEEFLERLREFNFSRVPVYSGLLDNITGIAFAHDLLQIADEDARTRTLAEIARPAVFVPETKRGYELLREMQREKQHMRIVIDEYGGVAGLVTIEDLLEQIVGDIKDEHETDTPVEDPQREPGGSWLVPGSFPVDQLVDLFGEPVDLNGNYEAATLGGLVSEVEGRIPLRGEIVELDHAGVRIEVLASTDRHVERLRIFPPKIEATAAHA
jgi:CBS domain containing-hemolysin-like protein